MEKIIYLDHSATTKIKDEVLSEMQPFLSEYYGNASAEYKIGLASREKIEEVRENIADLIHADYSDEIYFTSRW